MVNQIEFHPGYIQAETVKYCQDNGILVEGWSPLGCGAVLGDPTVNEIAASHGKSAAHVCIRYALQHGVLPLPKSVTPSRIIENADVFDFSIADEDMALINSFEVFGESGFHPDKPGS